MLQRHSQQPKATPETEDRRQNTVDEDEVEEDDEDQAMARPTANSLNTRLPQLQFNCTRLLALGSWLVASRCLPLSDDGR